MNRIPTLICSFALGAFICATASADDPKGQKDALVVRGVNETLELYFLANCNVPQDNDDASIVPVPQRTISFDLVIEGRTVGGHAFGDTYASVSLDDGLLEVINVPASIGQLLKLRIENVRGQGVCKVSATGRIAGPSGETRATGLDHNMWATLVNRDGFVF